MKFADMMQYGLEYVINDMGEVRKTAMKENGCPSIVFPNGWVTSVLKRDEGGYSVAMCDYNGYFDWNILRPFGTENGTIECDTEEEACDAIDIIRHVKPCVCA